MEARHFAVREPAPPARIHDFTGAARHVLQLPYGRIADRSKFRLVLEEGKRLELEEETVLGGKPRTVRVVKTPVKDAQGKTVGRPSRESVVGGSAPGSTA